MFIDNLIHIHILDYLDYYDYIHFTMINKLEIDNYLIPETRLRLNKEKDMYKTAHYFLMSIKRREKYEKERDEYHNEFGYDCVCNKNYDGGLYCSYCKCTALCRCPYCQ